MVHVRCNIVVASFALPTVGWNLHNSTHSNLTRTVGALMQLHFTNSISLSLSSQVHDLGFPSLNKLTMHMSPICFMCCSVLTTCEANSICHFWVFLYCICIALTQKKKIFFNRFLYLYPRICISQTP